MNLKKIEQYKIFETIAGSRSYGLNNEQSDIDLRGIFILPKERHLSLEETPRQVGDKKNDIMFYELKRFFELASGCNPNIIELLYMPEDCIKICTPMMQKLIDNRDLFLSQKAFYTFSGYAHAQIKKAKGRNKWVNNPWGEERPKIMDYMYTINRANFEYFNYGNDEDSFPCRPEKFYGPTKGYKVSRIEHGINAYRLYYVDETFDFLKGNQITCSSISKHEERNNFEGILTFNDVQYQADVKNWKGYWEWRKNRNDSRWESQESGEMDYDSKNMLHCFRLILSTKSILECKGPIVRFEGEQREFLMKIRQGEFEYDYLMGMLEEELKTLDKLKETTKLRQKVNIKKIEKLYMEMVWSDK